MMSTASSTAEHLREQLRELAAPLAQQLREVNERISETQNELDELRGMRRELEAVLGRLNGTHGKPVPRPKRPGHPAAHEQKIESVLKFLREHRQDFADGITVKGLDEAYRKANRSPKVSASSVSQIIETLHDRGLIRMDRVGAGGGAIWKIVGNAT